MSAPNFSALTTLAVTDAPDRLVVRLNRPEVRNAINQAMVDELHAVCAYLEAAPKVLILMGASTDKGAVFASGADIAELRERRREDALKGINANLFVRIAALPLPVIAALDGWVLGGGAELAYAADFRIGTDRIKIGNPETSLGILAAAGASWRLKELIGEPLAKEMLLAGRVLDAEESLACHLVTSLHAPEDLEAAAHELADRITAQAPLALAATKRAFAAPREEHPAIDGREQAELFESEEKFARMDAFLARRKAKK